LTTTYLLDISGYQPGITLGGWGAVAIKITEGTGYCNGSAAAQIAEANRCGAWVIGYHFLHAGNAAAQAAHALAEMRSHGIGGQPLMVDVELTTAVYRALKDAGHDLDAIVPPEAQARIERVSEERGAQSLPQLADITGFVDAYRAGGGICRVSYLPHWYWQGYMGSVSLAALASRGVALWSSAYTSYTDADSGTGWQPYGGLVPELWQYTASLKTGGYDAVDCSAHRNTLDHLKTILGGSGPSPDPTISQGDTGPAVTKAQQRLNAWGASPPLTVDGDFGPATLAAAETFQRAHSLTVDGIIGPATWAELNKTPNPPGALPAPAWVAADPKRVPIMWPAINPGSIPFTGYSVQAVQLNGVVAQEFTVPADQPWAVVNSLVPGWTYRIRVWANGGPVAPAAAEMTYTMPAA